MRALSSPQPVDPDALSPSVPYRGMKQLGLVLLCGAWVLLGLVGRDPWKSEDAIAFSIGWEMVQRGDWLVPHLARELALDAPPLVPWLSALGIAALSPPLSAPDAGRIAVGVLLVALLVLTGATANRLGGRPLTWMPVLILVGSVGLFDRSHQLSQEMGLAVAVALAMFGCALARERALGGGLLIGVAGGMAFLAAGSPGPVWALGPALLLPLFGSPWRSGRYAAALAVATVVAVPLIAAWPLALYERAPALLDAWLQADTFTATLPFVAGNAAPQPDWLARNLVWFAWPAVPLIAWMLWIRARGFNGGLADPALVLPAVFALWMLAWLLVAPAPRAMQMLPVLAPLAILGALEIDTLKRGQSAALDWFGILTFGLLAIALWAFWIDAYVNGMSARVAILLRDAQAGYGTSFNLRNVLAALLLTGPWIVLVRPARRSNRRAVLNWAAGITLIWGLTATIWLPYINSRRTYDTLGQQLAVYRPAPPACTVRRGLGDAQRGLFYYFGGLVTVPADSPQARDCDSLLVQYGRVEGGAPEVPGYSIAWQGARRGDGSERYVLYRKAP
jgi:4-amino-4-deoxy-L-arabinose transferase-like glycosyltransferase